MPHGMTTKEVAIMAERLARILDIDPARVHDAFSIMVKEDVRRIARHEPEEVDEDEQ